VLSLLDSRRKLYWLRQTFLTLHPLGSGYAIFAPFRLWTNWRPGQPGFDSFHGDLFSRGAAIVQTGASALVPLPPAAGARPAYAETVNFADAISVANHTVLPPADPDAPQPDPPPAMVTTLQTETPGSFAWMGGICLFPVSNQAVAVSSGRPAPVAHPDEFEAQSTPLVLKACTAAQSSTLLHMVPLRVQNLDGGPIVANISDYGGSSIKLMVWPGSEAVLSQGKEFNIAVAGSGRARVTVYDGQGRAGYPVAPNSRHEVTYTDLMDAADKKGHRPQVQQTLTADARGRLTIEFSGRAISMEIAPASDSIAP
jgi:hypothetical protein